jgi:hypothetical protein
MSPLASERNLPERLKSLRSTSATSVGSGLPPVWANGTTTIGVAVLRPPTMSTLSDWAATGPANSATMASRMRAKRELSVRMGLIIAA